MHQIRQYLQLTKPGIIIGNDIPAVAAFFLAARGRINIGGLLAMLVGLSLVIASACVTNNYLDRDIDAKMARTRKRATATGRVGIRPVSILAAVTLVLGALVLAVLNNLPAVMLALAGWFLYVVVYGWGKRTNEYGTLIGSLSGAAPPLVGYAAATGRLDGAALILFLILVLWQMPHFYAIAIYRGKEYQAAALPVWPLRRSIASTKQQIIAFTGAFTAAALALWAFGYTGWLYLIVAAALCGRWLWLGWQGRTVTDNDAWAHRVFGWSLITMTVLCATIMVDSLLHGTVY